MQRTNRQQLQNRYSPLRVGGLTVLLQGGLNLFQGGVFPPTGWLDKPLTSPVESYAHGIRPNDGQEGTQQARGSLLNCNLHFAPPAGLTVTARG